MSPLDIETPEALLSYLRNSGRVDRGETPRITPLKGGVSNRTVLVEREGGEAWVLKQALPKLRVKEDWFSDPARIRREALGLVWLAKLAPPSTLPPLIFEDPEHDLLAMKAVPFPHDNWKSMLLAGQIDREAVDQFGRLLGTIHREGHARRAELEPLFGDRSFFQSLRLEPYYRFSATRVAAAAGFLETLIQDTLANQITLVHGDYSPKNILVREGRLVLLDHEVVHFGDPAFDLGFSLTHLLSKANHVKSHRMEFLQAAGWHWKAYCGAAGDVAGMPDVESRAVRHTLGCLLARVAGRSPLEYLAEDEQARQREAVLTLMRQTPGVLPELFEVFGQLLHR